MSKLACNGGKQHWQQWCTSIRAGWNGTAYHVFIPFDSKDGAIVTAGPLSFAACLTAICAPAPAPAKPWLVPIVAAVLVVVCTSFTTDPITATSAIATSSLAPVRMKQLVPEYILYLTHTAASTYLVSTFSPYLGGDNVRRAGAAMAAER